MDEPEEPTTRTLHTNSHSSSPSSRRQDQHGAINELKRFAWIPLISMLLMHIVKPMCYDLVLPFISETLSSSSEENPYLTVHRSNGTREWYRLRRKGSWSVRRLHRVHFRCNESYYRYVFSACYYTIYNPSMQSCYGPSSQIAWAVNP